MCSVAEMSVCCSAMTAGQFDAPAAAVVTLSAAAAATGAYCSSASCIAGLTLQYYCFFVCIIGSAEGRRSCFFVCLSVSPLDYSKVYERNAHLLMYL